MAVRQYFPTGYDAVYVSETGHNHIRSKKEKEEDVRFSIACDTCDEYISTDRYPCSPDISSVPLTYNERIAKKQMAEEGAHETAMALRQITKASHETVTKNTKDKKVSALEDEVAELKRQLASRG